MKLPGKIILSTLMLFVTFTFTKAQGLDKEKVRWYDFYWSGDDTGSKDAMMLRSKIDSIDFNFRWQFDTGSPRTFFYGNVWNSFCAAFPSLAKSFFVVDSLRSDGFLNLKNGGLRISGNKLPKNIIGLLPNYGDTIPTDIILSNLGASTTVGTMGIDLFRNGVLIIDFKSNRIGYADKLSRTFYSADKNTIDFSLYQNRIILPVKIDTTTFYFFYDSGASLFPLKTTSAFPNLTQWINYTDTLYNITTWGKSFDVPGGTIKKKVQIGSLALTDPKIYAHPDPDKYHTQIFTEADTEGLLGNAYFDGRIIVIDFTRMKFSIL